jgi:hypothetical protein
VVLCPEASDRVALLQAALDRAVSVPAAIDAVS